MKEELIQYLKENFIEFQTEDDIFILDKKSYQLSVPNEDGVFFDEDFHWDCDRTDCDGYIFKFGGVWYTLNKGDENSVKLNRVKWIGKVNIDDYEFYGSDVYLGVHGPFELLNGTSSYKEWVKKAKFLGIKKLGICEKGTLAGVFKFQTACLKENIQPIFGLEVPVKNKLKDIIYTVKMFAKNEQGWLNLLTINRKLNSNNENFVEEDDVINFRNDIFIILDPKSIDFGNISKKWKMFSQQFYYQFDTVKYEKEERDKWYLLNLQKFFYSKFKPVAMCDAYYLDPEYSIIRSLLNKVASKTNYESKNQYFKNNFEYFQEFAELFSEEDEEKMFNAFDSAILNLEYICDNCKYIISTNERHLPKYKMTEEEEKKYPDNKTMFEELVYEGLEKHTDLLIDYNEDILSERIEREIDVIEYGDVVDYFLVLRDIVNWCNKEGILLGAGRGSAAGSLVTYLLGITRVDPLKYGLLFERFLNKGRIKVSLPDIDTDFPGEQRPRVKEYMEERFGKSQVCAVGTYTTLQLKAALTDLSKQYGVSISTIRRISKKINGLDDKTVEDLFKIACRDNEVKDFMNKYPELFNCIFLVIGQPKAASIHACAMMIFPDEKTLYEWCPVREQNNIIVSEWEGLELDEAGFLKEDILGIEQLDKFTDILKLIEKNTGNKIDLYKDIPKDDSKVFEYFKKGWLGDVFHFGAKGLSSYCVKMQPNSIDELSDCAALYRPGTIENGYDKQYLRRKFGEEEIEYHVGTEDILKSTNGLFVYQEQVMALMNKLAGMDLVTCDTARKAMGKKKIDVIQSLEKMFIEGYCKNWNVTKEYALSFWKEIVKASSYLFNKSHSVSYSINGYNSLWLKVHYPMEFWSVTFSRASKDEYPFYINELLQSGDIKLYSVDINKSDINVAIDLENRALYWAINSVSQVGPVVQEQLMRERSENGPYFSFEEFLDRNDYKGSSVTKSVVENLIYSGAFDELESGNYENVYELRKGLLILYRERKKIKIDQSKDIFELARNNENGDRTRYDWWWLLQQKIQSGFAFFDYKRLVSTFLKEDVVNGIFYEAKDFKNFEGGSYKTVMIGGYVLDYEEKQSRKGMFGVIQLESNYDFVKVNVYAEIFESVVDYLRGCEKSLLLVSGIIAYDSWKEEYVLQTNLKSKFVILKLA